MATPLYKTTVTACLLMAAVVSLMIACGGDGPTKPPPPTPTRPQINSFSASPNDIAPNAASTLTYAVTGADSSVLTPGGLLTAASSGSVVVNPAGPTNYRLIAYNSVGTDTAFAAVTMSSYVPEITTFDANKDTIVINDSLNLMWSSLRADSLVINQGVGKLAGNVGAKSVKPLVTTVYQIIAYNSVGRDTANLTVTVEIPADLRVPNGQYYRGLMGLSGTDPLLRFWVANAAGALLRKPFIHFTHLSGDGTFTADSLRIDETGFAVPAYTFSGIDPEAIIRASVPGVDSVDVTIRASHIVPGFGAQGQYVKLGDPYSTVTAFNGAPASLDIDPMFYIVYANYETGSGVVFAIADTNHNDVANVYEPVYEIILNTVYDGATNEGLGIASLASEFETVYGDVTEVFDPTPPPAYAYRWPSWGLTAFSDTTADRHVFEIHLYEPITGAASSPLRKTSQPVARARSHAYRSR